jgi:hypothetical protein
MPPSNCVTTNGFVGKRRVVEPDCTLSPEELEGRDFAALDAAPEPHLVLSDHVA